MKINIEIYSAQNKIFELTGKSQHTLKFVVKYNIYLVILSVSMWIFGREHWISSKEKIREL